MCAIASKRGLCVLTFEEEVFFIQEWLQKFYPNPSFDTQFHATLKETQIWLNHYFSKRFAKLKQPAIDLHGTPFATLAWKALLKIPLGAAYSYGALATKLGNPKASRAIGGAMSQNSIAILVPCHRVIGANGALTGFASGVERKQWLLEHEGYLVKSKTKIA